MERFTTEPVSCSGRDITSWVAGETRLTHDEALEVLKAVKSCGLRSTKRREDKERDVYRTARYKLLPVVGILGWLRICWWVWRAVRLLLDYYDRDAEAASGSSGG